MRAGQLRNRITFQQKTTTKSPSNGEDLVSWADVCTVWAEYDPVRGREFFSARQQQAETVAWFRIRYRAGLLPQMRISFAGKVFDILSIINVKGLSAEIEIYASEGLVNG